MSDMYQPRAELRRIHWSARVFTVWLALSVVFALTPCCNVYAVFIPGETHAAAPDQTIASPNHDDGDDQPCAAWLDRNDALPVEAGALLTAPPLAIPAPLTFQLPPVSFTAAQQPSVSSTSPPDALYLRYLRLIL